MTQDQKVVSLIVLGFVGLIYILSLTQQHPSEKYKVNPQKIIQLIEKNRESLNESH